MAVTTFQTRVLTSLRGEGLQIRKIVRIYPPLDLGEPQEVLFISHDRRAGTCIVDPQGKLLEGPFSGFGL